MNFLRQAFCSLARPEQEGDQKRICSQVKVLPEELKISEEDAGVSTFHQAVSLEGKEAMEIQWQTASATDCCSPWKKWSQPSKQRTVGMDISLRVRRNSCTNSWIWVRLANWSISPWTMKTGPGKLMPCLSLERDWRKVFATRPVTSKAVSSDVRLSHIL